MKLDFQSEYKVMFRGFRKSENLETSPHSPKKLRLGVADSCNNIEWGRFKFTNISYLFVFNLYCSTKYTTFIYTYLEKLNIYQGSTHGNKTLFRINVLFKLKNPVK